MSVVVEDSRSTGSGQPRLVRTIATQIVSRWRTVLIVALVTLVAALLLGSQVPVRYTATSTLVVSPLTTSPFTATASTQSINITTEREILRSPEVARMAAEAIGTELEADSALLTQVDVAAPTGSQVLQVSVSDSVASVAAESANALAEAYLESRAEGALSTAETYIEGIDDQLAALGTGSDSSTQTLAFQLREQRASLILVASDPGRIIGYATVPTSPSSLGLTAFAGAGLMGGLLLGLLAAVAQEKLDRRVRFARRASEIAGTDALLLNGASDREGARWILRAIRAAGVSADEDAHRQHICLLDPDGIGRPEVAEALATAYEATGAVVRRLDALLATEQELDGDWPRLAEAQVGEVVIVDGTPVASAAQRLSLAERCSATVALVDHRSSVSAAAVALRELANLAAVVFISAGNPADAEPSTKAVAEGEASEELTAEMPETETRADTNAEPEKDSTTRSVTNGDGTTESTTETATDEATNEPAETETPANANEESLTDADGAAEPSTDADTSTDSTSEASADGDDSEPAPRPAPKPRPAPRPKAAPRARPRSQPVPKPTATKGSSEQQRREPPPSAG